MATLYSMCASNVRNQGSPMPGLVAELADGSISAEQWKAKCQALGIAGVALTAAAADNSQQARIA